MEVTACIGCGFCCRKASCAVAYSSLEWNYSREAVYKHPKTGQETDWKKTGCPFLVWNGQRWLCGRYEEETNRTAKRVIEARLFFGGGCCSDLNTYRVTSHIPTPGELKKEDKLLKTLDKYYFAKMKEKARKRKALNAETEIDT